MDDGRMIDEYGDGKALGCALGCALAVVAAVAVTATVTIFALLLL